MAEEKELTVKEAGRRGGEAVKKKYGAEFYAQIGRLGGERTKQKYGVEFYAEIGKRGGKP